MFNRHALAKFVSNKQRLFTLCTAVLIGTFSCVGLRAAFAWTPPIGIPEPDFGIEQTVENSCGSCTRKTQSNLDGLSNIPKGTVIEINAGTYTGGSLTIGGNGTSSQPIFVRGKNSTSRPKISRPITIKGSYIIVENIDFDFDHADKSMNIQGNHIALRHSEVHNFYPGHYSTTVFVSSSTDIVLYDNHIHDNGDFGYSGERDVHGIGASSTHRLWIVDSHLHHNRGDSVQFGHKAGNTLGDFYIGRNEMHDDGENRVDIKETSNVVISENTFYNAGSGYPHVVLHDCPENAAVLYNNFSGGTGVESGSLESACNSRTPVDLFIIGNDLDLISGWGTGKRYYVCGNTGRVDLDNQGSGTVITSSMDQRCFDAFYNVYGIDLNNPGGGGQPPKTDATPPAAPKGLKAVGP